MNLSIGSVYLAVIYLITACSANTSVEADTHLSDTTSASPDEPKEWFTVEADNLFHIDLPINMTEKKDLNTDASLEYAYMEKVADVVKEHYVIVMTDTKEEIESWVFDFICVNMRVINSKNL